MEYTKKLFDSAPFIFTEENKAFFLESFKELAEHHYKHNQIFRGFWQLAKTLPSELRLESDLSKVPPIMVHLFKERELISTKKEDVTLTLTSSGTGGQKSQMFLDSFSLANVKKLAFKIHEALGMTSSKKYNYLCFTYDPKIATDLGTAFTDELLTSFTGVNEVYYAIQWDGNEFKLNTEGVIETLRRFEKNGFSTRILGFPAFLYKIIKDHKLSFSFGTDSWVQTGGGWKGATNEEIPKAEFRKYISEKLKIPEANIRDMFGMVEHGIPYVDCELGNLHIPNYSRVFIRSPKLELLQEGEVGLIHFLCSYNTSTPSISLLTNDWGKIETCPCRLGGKTLRIVGRAGITKHKGCAIKALEVLK